MSIMIITMMMTIHSFTHSLLHSFISSLINSFTHSLRKFIYCPFWISSQSTHEMMSKSIMIKESGKNKFSLKTDYKKTHTN